MEAKSQTVEEKLKLALQLQAEKEYSKSNKHLIDLYSTNDMKELVCLNLAKNYFELENMKMAGKYAKECIDLNGEYSKDAAIIQGQLLDMEGRYEEEVEFFDKMLARFPNNYDLNLWKSCAQSQLHNNYNNAGVSFYKTIKTEPLNRKAHYLIAYFEEKNRHYVQSVLANFFQMFTSPNKHNIRKIVSIVENRQIRDAMQDVIYSNDTTTSESNMQLFWAMAFFDDLQKCDIDEETQLPDAECFIYNSKTLLDKICGSVVSCKVEEERTHADFYIDFFRNILEKDFFNEYIYYCLINAYPNIYEYIPGMNKARMNRFADFLEEYFK